MRVDFGRLKRDLLELGRIGRSASGGVTRPSWSDADVEARRWLLAKLDEAGLQARVDAAGNILGRWQAGAPAVLVGSHIDTVPEGGTLDGALGVLAGLECLRRIKEDGVALRHPLELVAFTDEEGAFGGFFGSYAFTGALSSSTIPRMRDVRGTRLMDAMARHGLDALAAPGAARDPKEIQAYVELHIEQGPVLERRGIPIGVVEQVVGIARFLVTYRGRADHAGTTPMADRKDALLGAAELILQGRELIQREGTAASRVTVGMVQVVPGVTNIVPAVAALTYELREVDAPLLRRLAEQSQRLAKDIASRWDLEVSLESTLEVPPVPLAAAVQEAIVAAAKELGLPHLRLPAMAGHDAQVVGRLAPAGMIFVPSKDGRSHSPLEATADEDLERGANVLLGALLRLAS
ncbi:MAG TPA: Zn-dependent hydrolase [Candidatus Sulfotelmatobacter sp.]|nr:Zn-dependent hydrolase [Candidatus Sulfotelmatobacter sp.]